MKRRIFRIMLMVLAIVLIVTPAAYADSGGDGVTIDLTPLFQAVVVVLATIITAKVVPWIKEHTTAQQQATASAMIKIAVYAAEQIYGSGGGQKKLDYVESLLLARGFKVDRNAIEATVRELSIEQAKTATVAQEVKPPG